MKKRKPNNTDQRGKRQNRESVRRWLHGYKLANKVAAREERELAVGMTPQQARKLFYELNLLWERSNARAGGDWQALDQIRIKEKIRERYPFVLLGQRITKL